MKNILLTIEYDGTNFHGWQRQPKARTVQGRLEEVLSHLCKQKISLNGSSRTDAGVHAYGQRASFKGKFGIPTEKIPLAANRLLSDNRLMAVGDVRIIRAEEVDIGFHPRYDAKGKKYLYKIKNTKTPDIMKRNYYYQIEKKLDIASMKKAADFLVGQQDFKSFMAAGGKTPETTVRTIYKADVFKDEGIEGPCNNISLEIIGDGFLYNMVRIIAGTLVEIGLGALSSDEIVKIISNKNRQDAGHTAPPGGLYLSKVYFNTEEMLNEN